MVIDRGEFISGFQKVLANLPLSSPVLVHSDLMRVGFLSKLQKGDGNIREYHEVLSDLLGERSALFPTFDYTYGATRTLDLKNSRTPCGALGNFFIKHFPEQRTHTPIFNFAIKPGTVNFSHRAADNAFGPRSNFGELHENDGYLFFLGSPFRLSNTFSHYIEERANIGYRYLKDFPGTLVLPDGKSEGVTTTIRVRPVGEIVEYDWVRLEQDALKKGLLKETALGNDRLQWINCRALTEYWMDRIREDELFLLDEVSRAKVEGAKRKHRYPFALSSFEGAA